MIAVIAVNRKGGIAGHRRTFFDRRGGGSPKSVAVCVGCEKWQQKTKRGLGKYFHKKVIEILFQKRNNKCIYENTRCIGIKIIMA